MRPDKQSASDTRHTSPCGPGRTICELFQGEIHRPVGIYRSRKSIALACRKEASSEVIATVLRLTVIVTQADLGNICDTYFRDMNRWRI